MIKESIAESIAIKQQLLSDQSFLHSMEECIQAVTQCFQQGHKVMFCGNGGSAADAQHLAAELSGKFYLDRSPLPAEACHVNSSFITAVANDYSFEEAYARYIKSTGHPDDLLIAISTSGNSRNIVKAIKQARQLKMKTIGLTGATGGQLKSLVDFLLTVPSSDTARIQENHILIGHLICEQVEKNLFA